MSNPFDAMRHRLRQLQSQNIATGERMTEMRPRFERMRDRHLNDTAPRAVSSFNLFPTPLDIVRQRMLPLMELTPDCRWLEPSAGTGNILLPMAAISSSGTVVEKSADICAELYRLTDPLPGITLLQGDFLQQSGLGPFNVIGMNPPFHMRSDIKHILHAVDMLAGGGRLVAICMAGPAREAALRPLTDHWAPLGRVFPGTKTETILLRIRKPFA